MIASPMITHTTTTHMTVSCHIAYEKNGFPRFLTSSLYCWKTRRRSTTRSLAIRTPSRPRRHQTGAAAVGGDGLERPGAGGLRRPRRRCDAEPDDEVQVQADQREDPARDEQHVDRVEARQGVGVD